MNLAIFSEDSLYFDGENYVSKNPLTKLYAALDSIVGDVTLSGPTKQTDRPVEGYVDSSITYSPRPHYGSVVEFVKHSPSILSPTYRNIKRNVSRADLVMIRLPSPIGLLVYRQARKHETPYFVYLAGDIRNVATGGEKYEGSLVKMGVSASATAFHWANVLISRGTLTFTTGSALRKAFNAHAAHCVNLVPSVISERDIHERGDACRGDEVHLLFVGRLVPVKGLKYLLKAIQSVVESGVNVHLRIVGDGQQRPQLEQLAGRLGIAQRVTFCGHVAFGPELLDYYRSSDVFVLPSLSEGVPKTLTEAMASGVPVVATDVGGVSDAITHGETGLLIGTRSASEIHDAVMTLIENPSRRRTIIENGYEFVRQHTVNAQAELMAEEIRKFYSNAEGSRQ
ncbi:glycosyltransferase family 4 protein [Halobium palmae]|uniref:Glycosyltransferase family 4 protein n=1 Tax=Halobium palmae TaxID=1776492 RepID=A0ABD5RVD4_9EURY